MQNLKTCYDIINPLFDSYLGAMINRGEFHANNLNTFKKVNGNVRTGICADRKLQILYLERTARP